MLLKFFFLLSSSFDSLVKLLLLLLEFLLELLVSLSLEVVLEAFGNLSIVGGELVQFLVDKLLLL